MSTGRVLLGGRLHTDVVCDHATSLSHFAAAGPRLWNSLPTNLRQMTSYGQFKRHLKNHIYLVFFGNHNVL